MNSTSISVICAQPARQQEIATTVPAGTTLQQALASLAGEIARLVEGEQAAASGVWGKVRPPHYVLREGDRIEIYRPLKADPTQARRHRAALGSKRG